MKQVPTPVRPVSFPRPEINAHAELLVNGCERPLGDVVTIFELVNELHLPYEGCAVAVNGSVLGRAEWSTTPAQAGDRVEIVVPAMGG